MKRRRQPKGRDSRAALAMLTLRPVLARSVPRHHVEPKAPDGVLIVHDRATSDQFVIYSPRFVPQFQAGHRAGKWYLRPLTDLGAAPCSPAFPAAGDAVNALRAGRWSIPAETRNRSRKRLRVSWSETSRPSEGRPVDKIDVGDRASRFGFHPWMIDNLTATQKSRISCDDTN
jgi:hypothetical protein